MPTSKNEISEAVTTLGWSCHLNAKGRRINDPRYKAWRYECETYAQANDIRKKQGTADATWHAFKVYAYGQKFFPSAAQLKCKEAKEPWWLALDRLLQDILKKMRESKGKRRQAAVMAEIEEEEDGPAAQDEPRPKIDGGRAVYIYVLDPENPAHRDKYGDWVWYVPTGRQVAVLYRQEIAEVISKDGWHVPEGRTVREVFGALENPLPRDNGVVDPNEPPADWLRLTTTGGVDGFFR